jgi:hypothetical protein
MLTSIGLNSNAVLGAGEVQNKTMNRVLAPKSIAG